MSSLQTPFSMADSFALAEKEGVKIQFYPIRLEGMHENSVQITFLRGGTVISSMEGSSIGGGEIIVKKIDGFQTELSGRYPAILVKQEDKPGVISFISTTLAKEGINIAAMNVSRTQKSKEAACVIEVDDAPPEDLKDKLLENDYIKSVRIISSEGKGRIA